MNKFTYDYYEFMLREALASNYIISSFPEYDASNKKTIIMRHDVDYTLNGILELAKIERNLGVTSSYLFRVHAHEYNLFAPHVVSLINYLRQLGHDIGLHFEAPAFARALKEDLGDVMKRELLTIETILKIKVKTVSEHKDFSHNVSKTPSLFEKYICDDFGVLFNAMDEKYFKKMKYLSDSNAYWREGDLLEHLNQHDRFQILIHPDWWYKDDLLLKGPYHHGMGNVNIDIINN